jgi:methanogenic corrinoid protein MtbC1
MKDIKVKSENFKYALMRVDRIEAEKIFKSSFKDAEDFKYLEEIVISALNVIGEDWDKGYASLAQVYMSGIICENLMDEYLPKVSIARKNLPKIGICVLQDFHTLGKRIVSSIVKSGGYELIDFGPGLSPKDIVEKVEEEDVDIILISTLMLPAAIKVREVKQLMQEKDLKTKIVVGGAPFRLDKNMWKIVGADASGDTASDVLKIIEGLV